MNYLDLDKKITESIHSKFDVSDTSRVPVKSESMSGLASLDPSEKQDWLIRLDYQFTQAHLKAFLYQGVFLGTSDMAFALDRFSFDNQEKGAINPADIIAMANYYRRKMREDNPRLVQDYQEGMSTPSITVQFEILSHREAPLPVEDFNLLLLSSSAPLRAAIANHLELYTGDLPALLETMLNDSSAFVRYQWLQAICDRDLAISSEIAHRLIIDPDIDVRCVLADLGRGLPIDDYLIINGLSDASRMIRDIWQFREDFYLTKDNVDIVGALMRARPNLHGGGPDPSNNNYDYSEHVNYMRDLYIRAEQDTKIEEALGIVKTRRNIMDLEIGSGDKKPSQKESIQSI